MKTAAIGIALLALAAEPVIPIGTAAHATTFTCNGLGRDVHWRDRYDTDDARFAITTEDGELTLLLTDFDVVFQLSNRTFRQVERELRDAERDQDNWFGSVIVATVTATVREMLDHSLVCHVRDLRDVSYEDGRLVFIGRNGRAVFGNRNFCDSDARHAFSEHDAERFVREFQRLKAGD